MRRAFYRNNKDGRRCFIKKKPTPDLYEVKFDNGEEVYYGFDYFHENFTKIK